MIVERRSQGLGLPQRRQNTLRGARRQERRAQGEPEVDGLLARGTLLRQTREGTECLLEVPHGLVVGQSTQGLVPCLPAGRPFAPEATSATRSGASASRASTIRACSTRRRACSRLP